MKVADVARRSLAGLVFAIVEVQFHLAAGREVTLGSQGLDSCRRGPSRLVVTAVSVRV
jgi:hypothetical protein